MEPCVERHVRLTIGLFDHTITRVDILDDGKAVNHCLHPHGIGIGLTPIGGGLSARRAALSAPQGAGGPSQAMPR